MANFTTPVLADGFGIDAFRSAVTNVARSNLFYVVCPVPSEVSSLVGGATERYMTFLAQSGTLPAREVESIAMKWQGYNYEIGSTSKWNEWKVDFLMDADATGYSAMKAWVNMVHNPVTNVHGDPGTGSNGYVTDKIKVQHLHHTGSKVINEIQLIGAWPSSVGEVALKPDANTTLTIFSVTFKYVYAKDLKFDSPTT